MNTGERCLAPTLVDSCGKGAGGKFYWRLFRLAEVWVFLIKFCWFNTLTILLW
jgi:hypothetical protein